MFLASSLLLALAVVANPIVTVRNSPVTLSFSRKINLNGALTLYEHDRARADALKSRDPKDYVRRENTPAQNQAVAYVANVKVGSPPTAYDLIVDTGSSNTWIGAGTAYKPTSTSQDTGNTVSVSYGSGSFSGREFIDTVDLGGGLVINNQSIGISSRAQGFEGVDGILGIGPVGLTEGTVRNTGTVPTVTNNLFSQGTIRSDIIGVSFEPTTSIKEDNGVLSWGGTDSSRFTGIISYVPITSTYPAREYWGIDQSITYGSSSTLLSTTAGIVDTGTTLLLIASDAFSKYKNATGGEPDLNTGLLKLSSSGFLKLQSLFFLIGGVTFEFTANAQIWPRSLNAEIGGSPGNIYLIVGDIGSDSGKGLDFINGQSWLERFYSAYDTENSRVGIATTSFTNATSN